MARWGGLNVVHADTVVLDLEHIDVFWVRVAANPDVLGLHLSRRRV